MAEDWARPVVHWHIDAKDQDNIRTFYREMFNWTIADGPLASIGAGIGGVPPEGLTGNIFPAEASRVVLYIQVLDLRTSMAKAESMGGAIVAQPIEIPNGPTLARIADPEGNHITLVQQ